MMPIEKYKLLDILKSVNYQGAYKCSHMSAHRQPEKHPSQHPSEGTLATIHRSSDVWTILQCMARIHTSEVWTHTSEFRCIGHPYIRGVVHTSEDGPYIGAPMFEHAFRCMAMCIRCLNYHSVFHSTLSGKTLNRLAHTITHLHFSRAFYQVIILNFKNQASLKFNFLNGLLTQSKSRWNNKKC